MGKNKKIKIFSIVVAIILITCIYLINMEYTSKKRRTEALKYYNEIMPTITLADVLEAKLEYSDKRGHKGILNGKKGRLIRIVSEDIELYCMGKCRYLYQYKIIEDEYVNGQIENFNNNMENIRISNPDKDEKVEKTISEGEGLGEFHKCDDLNSLIDYMRSKTDSGEYYIEVLDVIGINGSDLPGRVVYKQSNGEEKVIFERDTVDIYMLFRDNSK
mgnify:CR=1 FL=1